MLGPFKEFFISRLRSDVPTPTSFTARTAARCDQVPLCVSAP